MAGNRAYYTSDEDRTPMNVKTYSKKKFEPEVTLWIAMSSKGVSSAVIASGRGMALPDLACHNIGVLVGHVKRFLIQILYKIIYLF